MAPKSKDSVVIIQVNDRNKQSFRSKVYGNNIVLLNFYALELEKMMTRIDLKEDKNRDSKHLVISTVKRKIKEIKNVITLLPYMFEIHKFCYVLRSRREGKNLSTLAEKYKLFKEIKKTFYETLKNEFDIPRELIQTADIIYFKRFFFEVYMDPEELKFKHLFLSNETIKKRLKYLEDKGKKMTEKYQEKDFQTIFLKYIEPFSKPQNINLFDDKVFPDKEPNYNNSNFFLYLLCLILSSFLWRIRTMCPLKVMNYEIMEFYNTLVPESDYTTTLESIIYGMKLKSEIFFRRNSKYFIIIIEKYSSLLKDLVLQNKMSNIFLIN
jgi:hypothetical protein